MNYVIVGASAAGINAIKTLRHMQPDATLTLISKDEHIYSRCILHRFISGERDMNGIGFVEEDFINAYRINWIKGVELTKINTEKQELNLCNGEVVTYDKVLLATGSRTFFPPITNLQEANNVVGLRTLDDAQLIKEKATSAKNIVVMGAGLVGIDVISGLLDFDVNLTLVEFKGYMLSMQLDKRAAETYEAAFATRGVEQHFDVAMEEVMVDEAGAIKEVKLSNDTILPCDLLIVAAGVRSNVSYLEGSDVTTDKFGLVFNELGETNVANVYGAGDVSGQMPIWPVAVKEGIIAASNMAGKKLALTDFFASKSTMNFLDVATLSLGVPEPADNTYKVDIQEDDSGNYKKIIHKDGVIYGAIIQGDLSYAGILTQLIKEQINIKKVKKPIFEIDYSDFFQMTDQLQFEY